MPKKLGDLLSTLLHKTHDWKITLLQSWPTIVGPLHTKVHIEKITDTALILAVKDSCWLQELYLLSPVLLKTINKTLDQPRIKTLRFKVATSAVKNGEKSSFEIRKQIPKKVVLSSTEKTALEKIHDCELRQALHHFLERCYQERGS